MWMWMCTGYDYQFEQNIVRLLLATSYISYTVFYLPGEHTHLQNNVNHIPQTIINIKHNRIYAGGVDLWLAK